MKKIKFSHNYYKLHGASTVYIHSTICHCGEARLSYTIEIGGERCAIH